MRTILVGVTAMAVAVTAVAPVATADAQPPAPSAPAAAPVADPRVAPELVGVSVSSPAYDAAASRYLAVDSRRGDAQARLDTAVQTLATLEPALPQFEAARDDAQRRRIDAARRLDELRQGVQSLAVAHYVNGGLDAAGQLPMSIDDLEQQRRRQVVVRAVNDTKLGELSRTAEEMRAAEATEAAAAAQIDEIRMQIDSTRNDQTGAQSDLDGALAELARLATEVADARLEADVDDLDLRFVVLDAYVKAASGIAAVHPSCGMHWSVLAGIGRTESRHGTHGGAVVQASGLVSKPIIGIPLDGTNQTAVINDTDGGALDGDLVYDRAVGPMQFIPGTWRSLGLDGNADGIADPQNIYDAALAAANLLCRSGPLDTDERLRSAFLRYNNSRAYAQQVLDRTQTYARFAFPPVA